MEIIIKVEGFGFMVGFRDIMGIAEHSERCTLEAHMSCSLDC